MVINKRTVAFRIGELLNKLSFMMSAPLKIKVEYLCELARKHQVLIVSKLYGVVYCCNLKSKLISVKIYLCNFENEP